jgi:hypothetical protein
VTDHALNAPLEEQHASPPLERGIGAGSIVLTETLHVWFAAQYVYVMQMAKEHRKYTLPREALDREAAHLRRALYEISLPLMEKAGYQRGFCTEPKVNAISRAGTLVLTMEWSPISEQALGGIIPSSIQPVRVPEYRNSEASGLVQVMENVHYWLRNAAEDIARASDQRPHASHWRSLTQSVRRMRRKLNELLASGAPMVPESLQDFLKPMSIDIRQMTEEAVADAALQRKAAYQLLVTSLETAVERAQESTELPQYRAGAVYDELRRAAGTLEVHIRPWRRDKPKLRAAR